MAEPYLEPPDLYEICPDCCGDCVVGTGRMSWRVDSATIDPPYEITEPCKTCNGSGYVEAHATDQKPMADQIVNAAARHVLDTAPATVGCALSAANQTTKPDTQ